MKKFIVALIFILSCVISGIQIARAQAIPDYQDVTISLYPEYPKPFESVDLTASSFSVPVDTVPISWFVNGQQVLSGVGQKKYTVRVGASGQTTIVVVKIQVNAGKEIVKNIQIQPNTLDLLWEAIDSYVPPFYKGKALPAAEAALRVTAIPNGAPTQANLVFNWLRNGQVDGTNSGFGKNFIVLKNNFFDAQSNLGVRIISPAGDYQSENSIKIARYTPFIRFSIFSGDQLLSSTINTGTLIAPRSQFLLKAEPFYISSRTGYHGLTFNWLYGDKKTPVEESDPPNELLLNPLTSSDTVPFYVKVEHTTKLLQEAEGSVNILFR